MKTIQLTQQMIPSILPRASFNYKILQIKMAIHSQAKKIVSLDFEVFGRVQGVFFRKYTVQKGKELGLNGWCMNTEKGTVVGNLQGDRDKVAQMKKWLQTTGSPKSKIERAEFKNEKEIEKFSYSDFKVRQ